MLSELALRRRGVSLIELAVIITILLIVAYFAIPSFVGDHDLKDDATATSTLAIAHNVAKQHWSGAAQYREASLAEEIERVAGVTTISTPSMNEPNPDRLYLSVDSSQQVTMCVRSRTQHVFCLRSNEQGLLHTNTNDTVAVAKSNGSTADAALCFLPTEGGLPLDCDSALGGAGWRVAEDTTSVDSETLAAPTVMLVPSSDSADSSMKLTWTTTGHVTNALCEIDAAAGQCDTLHSHTFRDVGFGAHTVRVTVTGPGGTANASTTWTRVNAGQSSYRRLIMSRDPAAYWRLGDQAGDGIARPETGGRTLKVVGSMTQGTSSLVNGDENASVDIASRGYLYSPLIPPRIAGLQHTVTMEAWISTTNRPRGQILQVGRNMVVGSNQYNGYGLSITDDGTLQGLFSGHCWLPSGYRFPASGGTFHVAASILRAPARILFYVNGVLVGQNTCASEPNPSEGNMSIGGYDWADFASNQNIRFNGRIDEVALYDRVLTAAELLAHYNAGREPVVG